MSRPLLPLLTVLVLLTACAEPEDDAVTLDEEAAGALAQGAQRLASALEGDDACGALAEADAVASQARDGVRAGTVPNHVANEVDAVTSEVTADLDCRADEDDEADQDDGEQGGDEAGQDGDGAEGTDPAESGEPAEPAPDPEPDPEPAPDPGNGSNGGGPDGDPPGQGPDGDGPPGHRDDTGPPAQAGGS